MFQISWIRNGSIAKFPSESIIWKTILLVLDDVWNENYETWLGSKNSLACGTKGSKILVTSIRLKHCFAYCRLFPKDCKINVQTLINLWMAQGFIKLKVSCQCLEDIG